MLRNLERPTTGDSGAISPVAATSSITHTIALATVGHSNSSWNNSINSSSSNSNSSSSLPPSPIPRRVLGITNNLNAELGMRQHCRDNVIMFSGQQWLIISLYIGCGYFIYTPGLNTFRSEALWCCRVVVVAKLNNCLLKCILIMWISNINTATIWIHGFYHICMPFSLRMLTVQ